MSRKKNKKGFTLSELLLVSAILAFVLCAILLTFISCTLLNEANRNLTVAISHAEYVMEEIMVKIKDKDIDLADIQSNITAGYWDWDSAAINAKELSPLRNEVIDTVSSGTDPLDVVVTVNWQDQSGRARSTFLETLFTE